MWSHPSPSPSYVASGDSTDYDRPSESTRIVTHSVVLGSNWASALILTSLSDCSNLQVCDVSAPTTLDEPARLGPPTVDTSDRLVMMGKVYRLAMDVILGRPRHARPLSIRHGDREVFLFFLDLTDYNNEYSCCTNKLKASVGVFIGGESCALDVL